jgi:VanZ family protein
LPEGGIRGRYLLATAIVVAIIVYGSLYPFTFRHPADGIGPDADAARGRARIPRRGDFIANILFYMPSGLSIGRAIGAALFPVVPIAAVCGALLSTSMEISQYYIPGYYIPGRVAAAADVFANVLGTALGVPIGRVACRYVPWPLFRAIAANRVPLAACRSMARISALSLPMSR